MASIIKRRVLEQLGAILGPLVAPEVLSGDVLLGDQDPTVKACFPRLLIRWAGPLTFMPFEDDEVWSTTTTQAVEVGDFQGQIQIELGTVSTVLRETLEDRLLNAFLAGQSPDGFSRPGVLVAQLDQFLVGGTANLATVPVAYVLQQEAWQEELVFDLKRFSSLYIDVDMPALVVRTGVPTIESLVLAITNDLASNTPTTDAPQVSVDENGLLIPYLTP